MKLSIEELKDLRESYANTRGVVSALDELIAIRDLKGDQVPVALKEITHMNAPKNIDWNTVAGWKAAIKAAGGTVKDGD